MKAEHFIYEVQEDLVQMLDILLMSESQFAEYYKKLYGENEVSAIADDMNAWSGVMTSQCVDKLINAQAAISTFLEMNREESTNGTDDES